MTCTKQLEQIMEQNVCLITDRSDMIILSHFYRWLLELDELMKSFTYILY